MQIFDFFISPAHAQAPGASVGQGTSSLSLILMTVVFILFMYFMVWRPQSKRIKEQRALLDSLSKGDEVVTAGGLLGRINKINDNYVVLALTDNVEITIQKSSIVNALPKGTLKTIKDAS